MRFKYLIDELYHILLMDRIRCIFTIKVPKLIEFKYYKKCRSKFETFKDYCKPPLNHKKLTIKQ